MKFLDMFIIVIIIAVGMFGFIFMSANSTAPSKVTDTFGNTSANAATTIIPAEEPCVSMADTFCANP